MTNHTVRLYTAALAILVFFVLWAAIAAHPWRSQAGDPRLSALAAREQALRRQSVLVHRLVSQRAAARAAATAQARRVAASPPAPSVRIVRLPPLVITRTS